MQENKKGSKDVKKETLQEKKRENSFRWKRNEGGEEEEHCRRDWKQRVRLESRGAEGRKVRVHHAFVCNLSIRHISTERVLRFRVHHLLSFEPSIEQCRS